MSFGRAVDGLRPLGSTRRLLDIVPPGRRPPWVQGQFDLETGGTRCWRSAAKPIKRAIADPPGRLVIDVAQADARLTANERPESEQGESLVTSGNESPARPAGAATAVWAWPANPGCPTSRELADSGDDRAPS